jgi:hypothetical protein
VFCEQTTSGICDRCANRCVALGGTPRAGATIGWPDRRSGTTAPSSGASAQARRHESRSPPRRAQRKGVVEAAIKYLTRSWWRTAKVASMAEAQASLDPVVGRGRRRAPAPVGHVGQVGAAEPLRALPAAAYPAVIAVERRASRSALVAFEGNRYSVGPAHAGRTVTVHARVGEPLLRVLSAAGEIVATHRRALAGAGQTVRSTEHAAALEHAVLSAFTTDHACRRKTNRPPGPDALAELARLKGIEPEPAPVIDLARYAELAEVAS